MSNSETLSSFLWRLEQETGLTSISQLPDHNEDQLPDLDMDAFCAAFVADPLITSLAFGKVINVPVEIPHDQIAGVPRNTTIEKLLQEQEWRRSRGRLVAELTPVPLKLPERSAGAQTHEWMWRVPRYVLIDAPAHERSHEAALGLRPLGLPCPHPRDSDEAVTHYQYLSDTAWREAYARVLTHHKYWREHWFIWIKSSTHNPRHGGDPLGPRTPFPT